MSGELTEHVVFACDAGMGSSAMGASLLRNKLKAAGLSDVKVSNAAIANLTGNEELIISHSRLSDRAKHMSPNALHYSVDNFMASPKYDEVVALLQSQRK
jgi:PTS system mannitol-specific IIC component